MTINFLIDFGINFYEKRKKKSRISLAIIFLNVQGVMREHLKNIPARAREAKSKAKEMDWFSFTDSIRRQTKSVEMWKTAPILKVRWTREVAHQDPERRVQELKDQ